MTRTLNAMGRQVLQALGVCAAIAACDPSRAELDASRSVDTMPTATARYSRLIRQQLVDSNPVALQELISCELGRLGDALGEEEMLRQGRVAREAVFSTESDRQRYGQVRGRLAGRDYQVGGAFCDSVNAIADREDPIVKRDPASSEARRP